MEAMALFKALSRTPNVQGTTAEAVPEAGRGVQATWRYTVGSIVLYCVVVNIVAVFLLISEIPDDGSVVVLVIAVLGLGATATLVRYCWFFRGGLGGGLPPSRYTFWLLVPSAALWLVGLAQPYTLWVAALPLWFACNALAVVVGRRARWVVLSAGAAALYLHGPLGFLLGLERGALLWEAPMLVSLAIWALITPLMFIGSIWWWEIVVRLDESRRTSGELAVVKERLRFAADLHDIQGHHLQVIALKTELASRLLTRDPEAARAQIEEAQQLARTALEETRALVHGYREISLAAEAANAAEVLRAADIECSVEVEGAGLPRAERTLFGLVIREATTNILRHSEARNVSLRLTRSSGESVLTVRNDGVGDGVGDGGTRMGGSGIDGLRRRFEAVGGDVRSAVEDSEFLLIATAPATTAPATENPPDVQTIPAATQEAAL